jgi:hypothetical protein
VASAISVGFAPINRAHSSRERRSVPNCISKSILYIDPRSSAHSFSFSTVRRGCGPVDAAFR